MLAGRSLRIARRLAAARPTALPAHGDRELQPRSRTRSTLTLRFAADFADVFEVRGHRSRAARRCAAARIGGRGASSAIAASTTSCAPTTLAFSPAPDRARRHGLADVSAGPAAGAEPPRSGVVASATSHPAPVPTALGYGEALRRRRAVTEPHDRGGTEVRTDATTCSTVWVAPARRGPSHAADGDPGRAHRLRRHSVVRGAVRARQHSSARSSACPSSRRWRAGTLRFLAASQGRVDDAVHRSGAGQDPARVSARRDGGVPRDRVHPLLRLGGCHPAVRHAAGRVPPLDGRPALRPRAPARAPSARWPGCGRADATHDYLAYAPLGRDGLANQGWKDSLDAIMHADGAARRGADRAGRGAGLHVRRAARRRREHRRGAGRAATRRASSAPRRARLRERFERTSGWRTRPSTRWRSTATGAPVPRGLVEPGALPVDSDREPEPRRLGRATPHGRRHVHRLGRAHARRCGERLYNPMSYHNGSVWPHDTAIAAAGLRRYGLTAGVPLARHRSLRGGLRVGGHAHARAVLRLPRVDRATAPRRTRSPARRRRGRPASCSC